MSKNATVSLWTIGPGSELYAAFGHSALRITDPVVGFDRIYNFGTFDFDTPNFYLKFIHGDLDYFLTAAIAPEILEEYRRDRQMVVEQQLNLTPNQADQLFLLMEDNLQPAHAAYRYDFVRDNCTTRIRDAVAKVCAVEWQKVPTDHPTLREMIQPYVRDRPQIRAGIDLLLGRNMDYSAGTQEAMFLPEDMKLAFDRAIIHDPAGNRPLVRKSEQLLPGSALPAPVFDWFAGAIDLFAVLGVVATWKKWRWFRFVDYFLFNLAGAIGCILLYLWLGTRHWVLHENAHLLWAWPTHFFIWFCPGKVRRLYWFLLSGMLVVSFFVIPCPFSGLFVLLAVRAFYRARLA